MAVRVSVNNDFSISRFPVKVDNEDNAYYVNWFAKKTPERRLFQMFFVNYKQSSLYLDRFLFVNSPAQCNCSLPFL